MANCCANNKGKKFDFVLWGSLVFVVVAYCLHYFFASLIADVAYLDVFSSSVFTILNKMFLGMFLGILFVGILDNVPGEFLAKVMGKGGTFGGVLRATAAGVLLDLCSHGILLVGMKLYKRGVSLGQVMAFLIASPWNSLSLTLVLWSLVGFWWTLTFLLLSMLIALVSGVIFNLLIAKGVLPDNPAKLELDGELGKGSILKLFHWSALSPLAILRTFKKGLLGSKMVLRWLLFGLVLAAAIRTFVPTDSFGNLFGPTLLGLGLTLLFATIIEVCSEGTTPVAADILNIAGAPGNAFGFLMTGISTDYTEILALKETTNSWKISLFLPLVTLPQVILLSIILNQVSL